MLLYIFVFSVVILCGLATPTDHLHPLSDAFIDHINKQGKWTAGRNFPSDTPMSYIERLMGTKLLTAEEIHLPEVEYDPEFIDSLPESFDARDKWPYCKSLYEIYEQGNCGSCWAVAAVSAMTDRYCIYSKGDKHFEFSAEDLLSCDSSFDGCDGGTASSAWEFWENVGLVSGGDYNSTRGCRPYTIPPPPPHASANVNTETPPCNNFCTDAYNVSYVLDKKYGNHIHHVKGESNMMAELYKNGPFEVTFKVFGDFVNYKGEVYEYIYGEEVGGHAVKLMGWGVENSLKYWLIANSWGTGWGPLGGFAKIRRGVNECHIEEGDNVAGEPIII